MSEEAFKLYLTWAIKDFAKDKVDAGNWQSEEALEKSEASFKSLLSDGLNTKDNYFFSIFESKQKIGMIWFFADYSSVQAKVFIYDFVIEEAFRRKGFGKAALLEVEEKVKSLNINELGLHVFAHNTAARKLYEQTGYSVTNLSMSKKLS